MKRIFLVSILPILSVSCGGGGSGGGSDGSPQARQAETYTGNTEQALLTAEVGEFFAKHVAKYFYIGAVTNLIRYEEYVLDYAEHLHTRATLNYSESDTCITGNYRASISTDSEEENFQSSATYNQCDLSSVLLDGRIDSELVLDSSFQLFDNEVIDEKVSYSNTSVEIDGFSLTLNGSERTYRVDRVHRTEQDLLVDISGRTFFLSDVMYEGRFFTRGYFGFISSLRGLFYDSEYGYVSMSVAEDAEYEDSVLILTGAQNSSVKVARNDNLGATEIHFDFDGDSIVDEVRQYNMSDFELDL